MLKKISYIILFCVISYPSYSQTISKSKGLFSPYASLSYRLQYLKPASTVMRQQDFPNNERVENDPYDINFDFGNSGAYALGVKIKDNHYLDLEYSHEEISLKNRKSNQDLYQQGPMVGNISNKLVSLNYYYNLYDASVFRPYIGTGIAYGKSHITEGRDYSTAEQQEEGGSNPSQSYFMEYRASDIPFYRFMLGTNIKITKNNFLKIGYIYQTTFDKYIKYERLIYPINDGETSTYELKYQAHYIDIGYRYEF